jgi:hypothetical protein
MTNKKLFTGILVMTLVFGMVVVSCASLGRADSALNGAWTAANDVLKLDNGKFELSVVGTTILKGTFTTRDAAVTLTPTHIWGRYIIGADLKWYTKAELAAIVVDNSDLHELFGPWTGTVNGNKLTLTWNGLTDTYTKR